MTIALHRTLRVAIAIAAVVLLQSCVAGGGAYYDGGAVDVGYGVDYYEPWGYEYGGWGPGYWVGPGRRGYGDHRPDGGGRADRGYRPAAPSRSMPSIPGRSRGR